MTALTHSFCASCGATLESEARSCRACGTLVHGAQLEQLAAQAQTAAAGGDLGGARQLWSRCLALLPQDTLQYRSIEAKVAELDGQIAAGAAHEAKGGTWGKSAAGLGSAGLLLWKFKGLALLVLTKGKLLLLGFTQLSTVLSMFAFLGVYWALYGWALAAGFVVSIYIHEMGHVIALRGYGIPASAPMFIPGFGAFIRMRSLTITPVQDARVGLAGPLYGLGAAVAALAIYYFTQAKVWGAIAQLGAVINLFNLIPVWQLDGGRGFHSLTRRQRGIVLGTALVMWFVTTEGMLFLVVLGCAYRMFFTKDAAVEPDAVGLRQFAALLVALAAVSVLAKSIAGVY